jgi:hypothetical protein
MTPLLFTTNGALAQSNSGEESEVRSPKSEVWRIWSLDFWFRLWTPDCFYLAPVTHAARSEAGKAISCHG